MDDRLITEKKENNNFSIFVSIILFWFCSFFLEKLLVSEYKIDFLHMHKFWISFWGTFLFNVGCDKDNLTHHYFCFVFGDEIKREL